MITKEQLAELASLARAATPGPWIRRGVSLIDAKTGELSRASIAEVFHTAEDGDFIAAANPATVLALIARITELEQDAARYRWLRHALINVDPKGNRGPIEMAIKNLVRQVHAERGVTEPTEDEFDAAIDAAMSTQAATERPKF